MKSNEIVKSAIILAVIALLLYLLFKIRLGLLYIFISLILFLIINPINNFLKKKLKIGNTLSSIFSVSILISFFSSIVLLIVPILTKQGKSLSLLNTSEFREKLNSTISGIKDYFESQNMNLLDSVSDLNVISEIDFGFVTKLFNSIIAQIGNLSIGILSILFITFFLLKDGKLIFNSLFSIFPKKYSKKISNSSIKIENLLTRYFTGVFIQNSILFVFYFFMLRFVGIENSFAIAFICAILNIVPYLGPLISIVLMILLSVTNTYDNLWASSGFIDNHLANDFISNSIFIFSGFSIIQLIDNFILQPYIFSSSVKSHPLEIFIVIIFSGLLFGIFGLIIAIPLYTTIKVIYNSFFDTKKIIRDLSK